MARRLSVAMIVRDEAEILPEFLDAVEGWADEVCLVDTGSSDDTVTIAKSRGCAVFTYAWNNDFAAARNESLRHCTGDWILVLDADERIAPSDWRALRDLTFGPRNCSYRLVTRNYTHARHEIGFVRCTPGDALARGFTGWTPSTKVRLFPNGLGAIFEGRIHELVNDSLARAEVQLLDSNIPIHHYPLLRSPERLEAKRQLYLRLGREKVKQMPEDPQAWVELGRQAAEMGDFSQAAAAYREAARRAPANGEILKELGATLLLGGHIPEARKALGLALQLAPHSGEAWRNLGILHAGEHCWSDAIRCFERAIEENPGCGELYRALGDALAQTGDQDAAQVALRRALEFDPDDQTAIRLLSALNPKA